MKSKHSRLLLLLLLHCRVDTGINLVVNSVLDPDLYRFTISLSPGSGSYSKCGSACGFSVFHFYKNYLFPPLFFFEYEGLESPPILHKDDHIEMFPFLISPISVLRNMEVWFRDPDRMDPLSIGPLHTNSRSALRSWAGSGSV